MENVPKNGIFGRDRRRTMRRSVHIPAYASLKGSSQATPLELCEVWNISESGTCIQAPAPLKVNRLLPLVLDLSETGARIHTTGHVVWAEGCGRTGIRFPQLPEVSLVKLREWMAANEVAGEATSSKEQVMESSPAFLPKALRPRPTSAASYTSLIAEWADIQKDVDLFGPNLDGALQLIAERALSLTWASGATIALKDRNSSTDLVCSARAGNDSPELGAHLDTTSGFSGECVRSSSAVKCDDTHIDTRVESESLRALGIRSLLACPIKTLKGAVIGVIEVFSAEPAAFWDNDIRTLEHLARIASRAVSQVMHSAGITIPAFEPEQKNVADASESQDLAVVDETLVQESSSTGRSVILFATGLLAVVFLVWLIAPWISEAMSTFISPPKSQAAETITLPDYQGASITDLRKIALSGSPTAQYALAMRYATGEGAAQDYHEGLAWFLKAADNGDLRAAGKIASCFWAGKGTSQDYSRAYFWGLLAQAAGDETGPVIVINSSPHLSDRQRSAEQQEADSWLRSHHIGASRSR